jgi:peptidoglycan/LPS O-acetylase OafA/YrhL
MSKAAVRHTWMFRTAAFVFLAFGAVWIWRFGFTDYQPEQRPWGLGAGALALLVGFYLFQLKRVAIGISAAAAAIVGSSAVLFALTVKGPGILFLAALAIVCVAYAVLSVRALGNSGETS